MTLVSERVIRMTTEYLGPASRQFLERQTKHHLNGLALDKLERAHLPDLAKWVNISAGLLIDKEKARKLADAIAAI